MLRATPACTFSTSGLPKVLRPWCVLYIFTSKCASRHNGVQFFISHLASWLRTRHFSEPTFRPTGATNHWKNTMFRDFPTFSRICIFFLLILSLLTILTSAFPLSILLEVSLLNLLRFSYLILSYPILRYLMLSYPILSYLIQSYAILCYLILSYPILSYLILSYPDLSYLILSYPILSYLILSYPILSYLILSYPILSYLILSYPI